LPGSQHALPELGDEEVAEGDVEGEYFLGATADEDVIFRAKTSTISAPSLKSVTYRC
jgi:hypothetical protein